jgi:two-component system nitrogen regulation response regulator GlnG
MRKVERPLTVRTMEATGGNQLRSAAVLGLNRNTLRKKIRELDIALPRDPCGQS